MKRHDLKAEARRWTVQELTGKINESKKRLIDLDQEKLLGSLKNVASRRVLRREIATLMTIRDERVSQEVKENA